MQDKGTGSPVEQETQTDRAILGMLLVERGPWSFDEVAREIGDCVAATDGLNRLYAAGLVHRFDGFVFAARAAAKADALV
jgi:hypothetical protein